MSVSGDRNTSEPGDPADLAGQLALGTLEGEDRVRALALYHEDPAFATEVQRWRERLVGLAHAVPPLRPRRDLWKGISKRIFEGPARRPQRGMVLGEWFGVSFWRRWALTATAGFGALALVVWQADVVFQPPNRLVVILDSDEVAGRAPWLLTIEPEARILTPVAFGEPVVPPDRVQELWVIPPGGEPHSLGLIEDITSVPLPDPFASAESLFAVSLEPPGGSPTGAPTGPVVYTGGVETLPR